MRRRGVADTAGLAVGLAAQLLGLGAGALLAAPGGLVGLGADGDRVLLRRAGEGLAGLVDLVTGVLGEALGRLADGPGLVLGGDGQAGRLLAEQPVVGLGGVGGGVDELTEPLLHLAQARTEDAQPLPRLVPLRGQRCQGAIDLLGRVATPGSGEAVLGDGIAHWLFPSCHGLRRPGPERLGT